MDFLPDYGTGSFRGLGCELGCRPAGCGPEPRILNVSTFEILSLIGDLPVMPSTSYLKVIVALVIPGAVAL